ncbi:hypothetical protein GGS24DRAFT_484011 [Hypoxylon argillaceum]|nr:hypothetical protein GGS24DRAFT_484011 [Hypoxylon argillaceum]
MCTQDYYLYTCGCTTKGAFHQCEDKYNSNPSLQCKQTNRQDVELRNYCAQHLVKENKAKVEYRERVPRQG